MKLGRTEEEFWFKSTPIKTFTLIDKYLEEIIAEKENIKGFENNTVETTIDNIPFF